MKKIILILLFASSAKAADFSFIQPMDNAVKENLKWDNTEYADAWSDWTLYAMITWPIVESISGNNVVRRAGTLATAHYITSSLTQLTKHYAKRVRPNGKSTESFFSGHTSAAFTGAAYLCAMESETKCYVGLGLATATGYLRIAAKKHWASDVLVGAVVGYGLGYAVPVYIFGF